MEESGQVLASLSSLSDDISRLKERCEQWRGMLEEGTYKLGAALNVVNGLKTKEEEIKSASKEGPLLQQLNEEQIDGFLEMLKTPAFQNLARQLLIKWAGAQQQP